MIGSTVTSIKTRTEPRTEEIRDKRYVAVSSKNAVVLVENSIDFEYCFQILLLDFDKFLIYYVMNAPDKKCFWFYV